MVNVASIALVYVGLRAFGAMDNSLEDMQVQLTTISLHFFDIFSHASSFIMKLQYLYFVFVSEILASIFLGVFSKYFLPCPGTRGEERSPGSRLGDQLLVQLPEVYLHWSVKLTSG